MKSLAIICACLWLGACGQRGALYLPEKRSAEVLSTTPSTIPSTIPSTTPSTAPQTQPPADPTDPDKKKDPPPVKE